MEQNSTKSRVISERLRQEILSGKFDISRKLPSEHQLMRRFSVARETVRVALKDLLKVDPALWKQEAAGIREFYKQFGDKLPKELADALDTLEAKLG